MVKAHTGFRSVQKAIATRPELPKARTNVPGAKKAPGMPAKKGGKC